MNRRDAGYAVMGMLGALVGTGCASPIVRGAPIESRAKSGRAPIQYLYERGGVLPGADRQCHCALSGVQRKMA